MTGSERVFAVLEFHIAIISVCMLSLGKLKCLFPRVGKCYVIRVLL